MRDYKKAEKKAKIDVRYQMSDVREMLRLQSTAVKEIFTLYQLTSDI